MEVRMMGFDLVRFGSGLVSAYIVLLAICWRVGRP